MKRSILKTMALLFAVILMASVVPTVAMAAAAEPAGTTVTYKPVPVAITKSAPKTILPAPGTSILIVTDAETGLPIEGAKYDLYRDNPFNGADTKVGPTYTTNKDGKITVSHTWAGDFYWVAAGEVEGYAADTAKHAFKIIGLKFATTEVALEKPVPVVEEPAAEEPAIAEEETPAVAVTEEIVAEAEAVLVVGGWTVPEDLAVTEDVKAVFDMAMTGLLGVDYTPLACVGTQLVAGMNYCVLCEAVTVVPDAEPFYALVFLYADLEGNAEITTIKPLEAEDIDVAEDGTVTLAADVDIAALAAVVVEEAPAEAAGEAEVTTEETKIG